MTYGHASEVSGAADDEHYPIASGVRVILARGRIALRVGFEERVLCPEEAGKLRVILKHLIRRVGDG